MDYSLQELTQASGHSADTVRYYQTLGLLAPPRREGRCAVYDEAHLERLGLIRSMSRRGLSLKVIRLLLERGNERESDRALRAALEEEADEPAYTSQELARRLGVPHALIASIERTGLGEIGETEAGGGSYSEADLHAARGAFKILSYGFPLSQLLALAVRHDRAMRRTVDDAIELFDRHVRKRHEKGGEDPEVTARSFKEILPVVTALVVHHFQRLLVRRALKRLRRKGEKGPLEYAVKVAARTRLGVRWS
jgi:DNA-binding transcriptional MerR regulator